MARPKGPDNNELATLGGFGDGRKNRLATVGRLDRPGGRAYFQDRVGTGADWVNNGSVWIVRPSAGSQ